MGYWTPPTFNPYESTDPAATPNPVDYNSYGQAGYQHSPNPNENYMSSLGEVYWTPTTSNSYESTDAAATPNPVHSGTKSLKQSI